MADRTCNDLRAHLDAEMGIRGLPGWTYEVVSDDGDRGWRRQLPDILSPNGVGMVQQYVVALGSRGGDDWASRLHRDGYWSAIYCDLDGDPEGKVRGAYNASWTALDAMCAAEEALGLSRPNAAPTMAGATQDAVQSIKRNVQVYGGRYLLDPTDFIGHTFEVDSDDGTTKSGVCVGIDFRDGEQWLWRVMLLLRTEDGFLMAELKACRSVNGQRSADLAPYKVGDTAQESTGGGE